jgi:hypothetical protein
MLKKKVVASLKKIIELFTRKFVTKLSKIWVWDPRSGIRVPEKTYSGSRIRVQGSNRHLIPDPGSRSATLIYLERIRILLFIKVMQSATSNI